jgi:drug/metabolite transporter (DMT)-like permease
MNQCNKRLDEPLVIELMRKQTSLLDEENHGFLSYHLRSRDVVSNRSHISYSREMMMPVQMIHDNFKLGVFYIVIGVISYAIMAFMSKLLYIRNPQITCWDVMLTRGIMTSIYVWMQANYIKVNLFEFKGYFTKVMVSSFFGCILYVCCLLSYQYVSVTKATLIVYANPIVVVVLAYFFLDERMTKLDIACLISILLGGFMTTMHEGDNSKDLDPKLGYFFATISCVSMGICLVLQRDINLALSVYVVPFHMSNAFLIP